VVQLKNWTGLGTCSLSHWSN